MTHKIEKQNTEQPQPEMLPNGLTKMEHFASMVLPALIADKSTTYETAAIMAARYAKALIKALKEESK
jgi:hypothetical protein